MSKCKKHLAPTPLNVDFSLREPSKKIIGFFFFKKNSWKKHGQKWLKMHLNTTYYYYFF